jgi:hypothetical protein
MIRQFFYTLTGSLLILLFNHCAQVVGLSGGTRDTSPPKLTEALPAQSSLNFNSSEILLKFDEYVQLKDLKNQLLISPSLPTEPEITSEGKKIRIQFKKEELLPNTTYRFYFGKAIVDMHEGNAIPNFEYVFSTGSYIDSLSLSGIITDAFSEAVAGDVLVGLYKEKAPGDSIIYKSRPDYVTRTLPGGNYKMSHLPQRDYLLVAFSDKNKNYIYDGETEKIGFLGTKLALKNDSTIDLKIFQELAAKTFIKKTLSPYYGSFSIIYNRRSNFKTAPVGITKDAMIKELEPGKEKDTISFTYNGIKDSLRLLVTEKLTGNTDTIKIAVPKLNLQHPKSLLVQSNLAASVLPVDAPFEFTFLNPLDTSRSNALKGHLYYLKDSTKKTEPLVLRYQWPLRAELMNELDEGRDYTIKLDTAAFYDLNGKYNDSLIIKFRKQAKNELGKITLKLLLNKKRSYIVQLTDEKGIVAKESYFSLSLSSSNAVPIEFTGVAPGIYTVRIVLDDNENKKWDTGDYMSNKQPENIFTSSKKIKVIADWDVEEEITVK